MSLGQAYYRLCSTRGGREVARAALAGLRCAGLLRECRLPLDCLSLPHAAVRGLMQLWQKLHWSSGDGMMPPAQLLAMYRLAVTTPAPGNVVELGAWTGLTTCYLATACRVRGDGRVFAVDTFGGHREHETRYASIERFNGSTLQAFHARVSRAGLAGWITPLVGYTSEMRARYAGEAVRLLLIDADHSYAGVCDDFHRWSPLVAPGGYVVFHDHDMPDVARFVADEVLRHPAFDPRPGKVADNTFAVTRR
jgi:predicted O-methyltransferase YrrM